MEICYTSTDQYLMYSLHIQNNFGGHYNDDSIFATVRIFRSAVYGNIIYRNENNLTSSPELMQRNPRSTRQAWTARITASNLLLSLYKRKRFFSFTSAILLFSTSFPGSSALAGHPRLHPRQPLKSAGNLERLEKFCYENFPNFTDFTQRKLIFSRV